MEPQKDRLEEYFRKKLESLDDTPSPGGWDVPSGNVWAGIEAGINKDKPSRRAGYFKYTLLLLLVILTTMLAWQWYASRKEIRDLTQHVNEQTAAIEALQNSLKNKDGLADSPTAVFQKSDKKETGESLSNKQFSQIQEAGKQQDAAPKQQPESVTASKKGTDTQPQAAAGAKISDAKKKQVADGLPLNKNVPAVGLPDTSQLTQNDKALKASDEFRAAEFASVQIPDRQPVRWPVFEKKPPVPMLPDASPVGRELSAETRRLHWVINPYFSPTYSYRSIRHKATDRSTPYEKTESPALSFTAGALAGLELSGHWRIYSGLSYQRFNQSSRHIIGLRYKTTGAVTEPGGNLVNSYQAGLQTSYGEAVVEVRIANDAQSSLPDLNEGRVFPVRFQTELELQHLGVPLLAEYRAGSGRLAFAVKGGLVGSFLLDKGMTITNVRTLHGRLVHRRTDIASDKFLERMKDFTLDLQLSAGLQLGLSKHLAFSIEPTFRSNLTPVFENEKLETRLFSLAVHTGVLVRF